MNGTDAIHVLPLWAAAMIVASVVLAAAGIAEILWPRFGRDTRQRVSR